MKSDEDELQVVLAALPAAFAEFQELGRRVDIQRQRVVLTPQEVADKPYLVWNAFIPRLRVFVRLTRNRRTVATDVQTSACRPSFGTDRIESFSTPRTEWSRRTCTFNERRASPSFGSRLFAWRTTGGLAGWKPRKFELWLKRTSLYS